MRTAKSQLSCSLVHLFISLFVRSPWRHIFQKTIADCLSLAEGFFPSSIIRAVLINAKLFYGALYRRFVYIDKELSSAIRDVLWII